MWLDKLRTAGIVGRRPGRVCSRWRTHVYEKTLIAGWGDMDFNAHMRNTAYLDKATCG